MENMVEVKHTILKKDTATASQKLEESMTLVRNRLKLIKLHTGVSLVGGPHGISAR